MSGVREEAAAFEGPNYRQALVGTPFEGVKRFRTFGPSGPMYEVTRAEPGSVHICVFDNGEELDYQLDRALADPQAE